MEYIEIDLGMIHPSPTNPRKTFPANELAEMAEAAPRCAKTLELPLA